MTNLDYLKRLAWQSAKLAWRVGAILVPLVGSMLAKAESSSKDEVREEPVPLTAEDAWVALGEGQIGLADYSYYADPYGDGLGS